MPLNDLERRFINGLQGGFPLLERPFESIAAELESSEDEIIDMVSSLLQQKLLSRFGPLYDAVRLGGGLTLAALSVPEQRFEGVTDIVNRHPEVAHNYRRAHALNMWFVLATEKPQQIESTLSAIEKETGLAVYNFPKLKEFYIGLWLDIDENGTVDTIPVPAGTASCGDDPAQLQPHDRAIIRATQAGLPLNRTPYQSVAEATDLEQNEVLRRIRLMTENGVVRRIGAVPNHYRLGLRSNGMSVWDVDDEVAEELGDVVGQLDCVSHCYLRPRHLPAWRYNLFAMVHSHTAEEVDERINQIAGLLGSDCLAHDTLYSTAILKKTGLRLAA